MKNVLVICGHSDYAHSWANRVIMEELGRQLPQAEMRILSQLYPDNKIDVEAEQKALLNSDIIVFQYPINWYDYPFLLKQYFDLVFLHNFAYGSTKRLAGKKLILSFTTGSDAQAYTKEGAVHMTIDEFLNPMKASANLCSIEFCKPLCSYDMTYIPQIMDEARKEDVKVRAEDHARKLAKEIEQL